MKWLWSLLAFIFAALFISAITGKAFLSSLDQNFEKAKEEVKQKSQVFADENYQSFYSSMDAEQKQSITNLNTLSPELKKATLDQFCTSSTKDEPICDPKFRSGESTFEAVVKSNIKTQFETVMIQALEESKNKFSQYSNWPLGWIAAISLILCLVLYVIANGALKGTQIFFGNIAWMMLFSVISFYFMPTILEKSVSTMMKDIPQEAQAASVVLKDVMLNWFNPAISAVLNMSLWITIISSIVWIAIKLYRKYNTNIPY